MRNVRIAILATALVLLPAAQQAFAISAISTTPARGTAVYGATASVSLTWAVVKEGRQTVWSNLGRLYTEHGSLAATIGTRISDPTVGVFTARLPETFAVPGSALDLAIGEGHPVLYYQREFFEILAIGEPSRTARFPIDIAGVPSSCGVEHVDPAPASVPVALGQAPIVSVRWDATFLPGQAAGPVSSPSGAFVTSAGAPLGDAGGGAILLLPSAGHAYAYESLVVPREIVYRAWKAGATRILYVRTFGDGACARTGQIVMDITGSGAAGFGLQRIALHFADGALARIVGAGDPLVAYADVTAAGTGFLEGAWEVADLTPGTPFFRTLALVSEHLLGSARTTLVSPPLPTGSQGLHLVRLRVTSPRGIDDPPTLRYAVGLGVAPGELGLLSEIQADGPGIESPTSPGARFSWRPLAGARAYQVELHEVGPGERFVSGMLIPASRSEAELSAAAFWHLAPDSSYRWRIVALGEGGVILGASPLKEFRTP